jgi:triacylglycerol lipase
MLNRHYKKLINTFWALTLSCISMTLSASGANSLDFSNIYKQATFSNAAYLPVDEVRTLVESSGFELTHHHTIADIHLTYFLATNELSKTQIISVRGTSNIENAMVDVSLKLVIDQNTGVVLHHGFAYAARQVYVELKPLLKPDYEIQITGHSLGGAVAVILAMYLDSDDFNIGQVVTFGQPKVTNLSGAGKLKHINVIRVVTPDDLVPLTPLFDPLDIQNIDVYWHAGREVILLPGTQYAILEGKDSMLRATKFTQKPLSQDNLEHHQMSLYLELVQAKTKASELVPYKTDLNLFNLFGVN